MQFVQKDFNKNLNPSLKRRDFIKACAIAAGALGLSNDIIPQMVEAATSPKRPPVVWLHFMECTGCTETLLRGSHPDVAKLILDIISLDYHETVMAAAGHQAEEILHATVGKYAGKYICVVEGAISTKDGGIYCKIGGRTSLEILKDIGGKAAAIIAIGTCATYGGVQAAYPNPTGAVGVKDIIHDKPIVNVSGCPPNPVSFLGTIVHYLTFNRLPEMDQLGRPLFAYGRKIHDHCERRAHFDEGRYAEQFGDQGHKSGYCLYKVGCKGPETYANCPVARFNDVGVWPVSVGHGCVGCTEPNFWDTMTPFYERLPGVRIPGSTGDIPAAEKFGAAAVGVTAAAVGIHAAVGVAKGLFSKKEEPTEQSEKTEKE